MKKESLVLLLVAGLMTFFSGCRGKYSEFDAESLRCKIEASKSFPDQAAIVEFLRFRNEDTAAVRLVKEYLSLKNHKEVSFPRWLLGKARSGLPSEESFKLYQACLKIADSKTAEEAIGELASSDDSIFQEKLRQRLYELAFNHEGYLEKEKVISSEKVWERLSQAVLKVAFHKWSDDFFLTVYFCGTAADKQKAIEWLGVKASVLTEMRARLNNPKKYPAFEVEAAKNFFLYWAQQTFSREFYWEIAAGGNQEAINFLVANGDRAHLTLLKEEMQGKKGPFSDGLAEAFLALGKKHRDNDALFLVAATDGFPAHQRLSALSALEEKGAVGKKFSERQLWPVYLDLLKERNHLSRTEQEKIDEVFFPKFYYDRSSYDYSDEERGRLIINARQSLWGNDNRYYRLAAETILYFLKHDRERELGKLRQELRPFLSDFFQEKAVVYVILCDPEPNDSLVRMLQEAGEITYPSWYDKEIIELWYGRQWKKAKETVQRKELARAIVTLQLYSLAEDIVIASKTSDEEAANIFNEIDCHYSDKYLTGDTVNMQRTEDLWSQTLREIVEGKMIAPGQYLRSYRPPTMIDFDVDEKRAIMAGDIMLKHGGLLYNYYDTLFGLPDYKIEFFSRKYKIPNLAAIFGDQDFDNASPAAKVRQNRQAAYAILSDFANVYAWFYRSGVSSQKAFSDLKQFAKKCIASDYPNWEVRKIRDSLVLISADAIQK